jgi:hypothetical protein
LRSKSSSLTKNIVEYNNLSQYKHSESKLETL